MKLKARGLKQCPNCNKFQNHRRTQCLRCKFNFAANSKKKALG